MNRFHVYSFKIQQADVGQPARELLGPGFFDLRIYLTGGGSSQPVNCLTSAPLGHIEAYKAPKPNVTRGYLKHFADHAVPASEGAVMPR